MVSSRSSALSDRLVTLEFIEYRYLCTHPSILGSLVAAAPVISIYVEFPVTMVNGGVWVG